MKKSRKEFIREAHNHACSEWKQKIEKEFPKLFKTTELEAGKWYKLTESYKPLYKGMVFQFLKYQHKDKCFAIVDHSAFGISDSNYLAPPTKTLTPATEEEVKDALIKEAKKRGFKNGVSIKYHVDEIGNIRHKQGSCSLRIDTNREMVYVRNGDVKIQFDAAVIFHNGKWAEIVETITKEEAEKKLGKTIIL